MTAMVSKGWVTYSLNLHKWEWHIPNDYPKAVADVLYRKGFVDSKQDFLLICLSQQGKPLNPKSTSIAPSMQWKLLKNCSIPSSAPN